jgi:hypothetical protein
MFASIAASSFFQLKNLSTQQPIVEETLRARASIFRIEECRTDGTLPMAADA